MPGSVERAIRDGQQLVLEILLALTRRLDEPLDKETAQGRVLAEVDDLPDQALRSL